MPSTYRAVVLKKKGGLEALELRELPLEAPGPGQVRVRVRASGVGFTDIIMLRGYYPYAPKFPFTPGYEVVGDVESLGAGVSSLKPGQRVAALTLHGGYGDGLPDDPPLRAHPAGTERAGDGRGRRCGHGAVAVAAQGATFINYKEKPFDQSVRALAPEGVDAAFDGIGGANIGLCTSAVGRDGGSNSLSSLTAMLSLFVGVRLRGRRSAFYGITQSYREDPNPLREDLPKLFGLLARRQVKPLIAQRLPLLSGIEGQEILERGGVRGKIVLLRDLNNPA